MRTAWIFRGLGGLTAALPLAVATAASAFPSYGTSADSICTANGWVPARPFNPNGGNANDPAQVNCGLCHSNAANPGGSFSAAGDQFRRSGRTDVTSFCTPLAANQPPVFSPLGAQSAVVGQLFELAVAAQDPEGGPLLLTVSNAPSGHLFGDAGNGSGSFRWTPSALQLGSHTLRFHAADTGSPMAVATLDVAVAVGPAANLPPVLAPIGNQQLDPGAALAFTLSAVDPESQPLDYSATGLPVGALLTGADFRWTPDATQVGQQRVTFTVMDAGTPVATDSETITISVGAINRPPVLAPIGDRQGPPGSELRVAVTASDPDRNHIALNCAGLPATASFSDRGDGGGELLWLPAVPERASVSCSATDSGAPPESDSESFTLAAVDPASGAAPLLEDAYWKQGERVGKLRVRGSIAPVTAVGPAREGEPGARGAEIEVFALRADGSAVLLGSGRTKRSGRFRLTLEPFVAPCSVAVASAGAISAAIPVRNAPAGCDAALQLRVRARFDCEDSELRVAGSRGPVGGQVVVSDADSGEGLAVLPVAGRKGLFAGAIAVTQAPRALTLRAESGGASWSLAEPLPIAADAECASGSLAPEPVRVRETERERRGDD